MAAPRRARVRAGDAAAVAELLDLAGALSDGAQLDVSVELLHRIVLDVAITTVNLDGLVRHAAAHLGAVELGQAGGLAVGQVRVLQVGGLLDEQAGGLDLHLHVRQLEADGLMLDEGLAEGVALLGICHALVQAASRHAEHLRRQNLQCTIDILLF